METQVINYASVLPGAGKTHWAVKALAKKIETKSGVTIYAAPTMRLLEEVRQSLEKSLKKEEHKKYIHFVASSSDDERVADKIRRILQGGSSIEGEFLPCAPGTVIMCSHKAFLLLDHGYRKGKANLPRRSEVAVIFDEVHRCASTVTTYNLPKDIALHLFKGPLSFESDVKLKRGTPFPADRDFHKVKINRLDSGETDRLMSSSSKIRDARANLLAFIKRFSSSSTEFYASVGRPKSKVSLVLHVVSVPYTLFQGWSKVVLLSAFIESSQMFHLLKDLKWGAGKKGPKLVNITEKIVDPKRKAALLKRYADTTIVWLSPNTSFSKAHLTKGVMIASTALDDDSGFDFEAFREKYRKLSTKKQNNGKPGIISLRTVLRSTIPKLQERRRQIESFETPDFTPSEAMIARVKLIKTLPGIGKLTPLETYARNADRIAGIWYARTKQKDMPLVICCNAGKEGKEFTPQINEMLGDRWVHMPFTSHGLNMYAKYNVVAFLATLNPKPETRRLMEQLCPNYDSDLDNTLDQCVQSVSRCSVRDITSKSKPLIIVTDKKLAERLKAQLFDLPKIISPEVFGIPLHSPFVVKLDTTATQRVAAYRATDKGAAKFKAYRNRPDVKAKAAAARKRREADPKKKALDNFIKENSKYAKRINSLTVMASVMKKAGSPKYAATYRELQGLRSKFKEERPALVTKFKAAGI